jgi:hypothetical protein
VLRPVSLTIFLKVFLEVMDHILVKVPFAREWVLGCPPDPVGFHNSFLESVLRRDMGNFGFLCRHLTWLFDL